MGFYTNKKVLVTGGTGLIGKPLVNLLLNEGAKVRIASLDDKSLAAHEAEFMQVNLIYLENCINVCADMDYVFHLAGIKGSPKMSSERPASFFVPIVLFNTNMLEAARQCGVGKYLYTSSIGVYSPAEIFHEEDVWKTFPSENDKFPGWAKRMGELQIEAYKMEYGWNGISIVRPANVYGPYDNFDERNATVIPSLIKRALNGENPLVVWGDGTPIRDFIHAKDVARGMLMVLESGLTDPVNLGSGRGYTIKEITDIILNNMYPKPEVIWDTSKPLGDKKRLMDITRAKSIGFFPQISLEDGIKEVMNWYLKYKGAIDKRYNIFATGRNI